MCRYRCVRVIASSLQRPPIDPTARRQLHPHLVIKDLRAPGDADLTDDEAVIIRDNSNLAVVTSTEEQTTLLHCDESMTMTLRGSMTSTPERAHAVSGRIAGADSALDVPFQRMCLAPTERALR